MQAVDMNTAGIAPPTVEKMSREDIYLSFRLGRSTLLRDFLQDYQQRLAPFNESYHCLAVVFFL